MLNIRNRDALVQDFRELALLWVSMVDPLQNEKPEAFNILRSVLKTFWQSTGLADTFEFIQGKYEELESAGKYRARHGFFREITREVE